jgi:hypothetical protein
MISALWHKSMMKFEQARLIDFMEMVGPYNQYSFKLKDGEDCFGEIEQVGDMFFQFSPYWDQALTGHNYERS